MSSKSITKRIFQLRPTANILTDIYVSPSYTDIDVKSILVCNTNTEDSKIRIALLLNTSDSIEDFQYLYYDSSICAGETWLLQLGLTLASENSIKVYSDTGKVNFHLFTSEASI